MAYPVVNSAKIKAQRRMGHEHMSESVVTYVDMLGMGLRAHNTAGYYI